MIPKIIWQTHKEEYEKLPKYIIECIDTWKTINPTFEYRYFNDKDMDSFILKYFGKEWLEILNNCPIKIMKVDTWKYMILYVYGGVYIDTDYICSLPIEKWLDKNNNLVIFQDDRFLEFTQAIFASEPKNIILEETLKLTKNDLLKINYKKEIIDVGRLTGYEQFSIAIDNVLQLKNKEKAGIIKNYEDFNNLDIVKNMKIHTPYFKKWDRFNKENPLFYTVHGRLTWENNYGNWLKLQQEKNNNLRKNNV